MSNKSKSTIEPHTDDHDFDPNHEALTGLKTPSKQALMIALLHRPEGASLEELQAVTDWQAHSVRGVISGVVRKKMGLVVVATDRGYERGKVYRIVGGQTDGAGAS